MTSATREITVCALCLQPRELCDSHIISEFLYLPLYDDKHRALAIKPEAGAKEDTIQKGIRERLLCKEHETQFSRYENVAKKALESLPDFSNARPGQLLIVETGDYRRFKLFQMSILWRMGIARQPSFEDVQLGPHAERLRVMLLAEDPGSPLEYGCFLVGTVGPGRAAEFLKPPVEWRVEGHKAYVAFFEGLAWVFIVSRHSIGMTQKRSFLSEDGALPINISSRTVADLWAGLAEGMREMGIL